MYTASACKLPSTHSTSAPAAAGIKKTGRICMDRTTPLYDTRLSDRERAEWLLSQLTLKEKFLFFHPEYPPGAPGTHPVHLRRGRRARRAGPGRMSTSRNSARSGAASSCARKGSRTDGGSAMSALTFPARMSWKRKTAIPRSTRSQNRRSRTSAPFVKPEWMSFWKKSAPRGAAAYAAVRFRSIPASAAAAGNSTENRPGNPDPSFVHEQAGA